MNRNHTEMEERRPETGKQSAPSAASFIPHPSSLILHPSSFIPHPSAQRASALITTLLVLVVLSTIVVAFMQSMSVERSVAKSGKNKLQAELAVQAGVDDAARRIANILANNPYHAVGYTNIGNQTITMIVGASSCTNTTLTSTNYLLSLSNMAVAPSALTATNSVALNFSNLGPAGWIGSPVGSSGAISNRECRSPWIYLLKNPILPHQPDSSLPNYNPYVARYAYWIEDESSKIDLMVAGNANGPGGGYLKPTNMVRAQDSDLGAAPIATNGQPLPTNAASLNSTLITFRNQLANLPPIQSFLPYVTGLSTNSAETSRFYTTLGSYASDLAGSGQKRINLNAIVTEGLAANTITSDLDDLIYSITGTHPYPGLNNSTDNGLFHDLPNTNAPFPDFGSRFYTGATAAHKAIYLKKIAANIRDYIDSDSQPTFVDSTGNVVSGTRPTGSWSTGAWPQAIGKEAIPYYSEHAWTGLEVAWSGSGNGATDTRTATLEIDHYIEFVNPSTKDYVAPPGTFIKLSNLPTWSAGIHPDIEIDDFELDVSGVTFSAGKATVITTNPGPTDPPGLVLDSSRLVRVAPNPAINTRRFENRLTDETINKTKGFQRSNNPSRGSANSDFATDLVLANNDGILCGLPVAGFSAQNTGLWNFKGQNVLNVAADSRTRFVYASGLRGNDADSRSGDVQSLSEQLEFQKFNTTVPSELDENTRFYGTSQGGSVSKYTTITKGTNTYVNPTKTTTGAWPDFTTSFDETASTAYAVIADQAMQSSGELGRIYDPGNRKPASAIHSIKAARGGGRTFKIGQPDDVIGTAARFSTAWQNAAWRLTDVFGAGTNRSQAELDAVGRGKINVNSVMRDGGVALRSLLRSFVFLPSPDSDPGTASKLFNTNEINNLILSISNYIVANGPIMERGELSQVPFFSGASTNTNTLAAQPVKATADRGREEIYRRMAELVTTRSASYSVYCVGEALQESSSGVIKTLSRSHSGEVFRFDPVMAPGLRSRATNYQATKLYEIQ